MLKRNRSTIVIVFIVILTIFSIYYFRHHITQLDHMLIRIGWWGPLFVVGLYTVLSLTPIPTDPLTLMMGALYGPLVGLAISWAGNTCAAILEYYLAHNLGNLAQFDRIRQHLPWGLSTAPVNSVLFLTLGRMVPGFGSKVVSILSGLYHVPKRRYLWTTALTNLVGSLLYVLGGTLIVHF